MIARLHNNKATKTSGLLPCSSSIPSSSSSSCCSRLATSIRRPRLNRRRRASLLKLAKFCPAPAAAAAAKITMMRSAPLKPARARATTAQISLPAHLPRPASVHVDDDALRKACPELGNMPLTYTREGLKHLSTHMYAGVQGAIPQHSRSQLPHELQVLLSEPISHGSICPTHVLAITSTSISPSTPRKFSLFAAHQLVLGAHCARLPTFPSSATARPLPPSTSNEVTMPVVRLALPAPEHFAVLLWYLYMQDADALRRSLLPAGWERDVRGVMGAVRRVHGVWADACALGVVGAEVYDVLEEVWQVVLSALARATGAPAPLS